MTPRLCKRKRLALKIEFVGGLVFAILGPVERGVTQEATPINAIRTYAQQIGLSRADLDGGRVLAARRRLEATDESLRSFEFDYLQARADRAAVEDTAPDLIRTVAKPDVDVRYGVLNEVDRQLVFICRNGELRIHDLASLETPTKSVSHTEGDAIWSGVFSGDGKTFFSGHQSGKVVVWDTNGT